MAHSQAFATPVSDGDTRVDVVSDRLKLDRKPSRTQNILDTDCRNTRADPLVPGVWVARMLRACGAALMFATALSSFRDLSIPHGAHLHGLAAEVVAFGIGLACC